MPTPAELEARQGQKMIEVRLRFWTNDIAGPGKVRQRHAWSGGVVRVERNESHGITPKSPIPFHSLLDVGTAIEKALIAHGIVLRPGPKMAKYLEFGQPSPAPTQDSRAAARSEAARKAKAWRTPQAKSQAARKANQRRSPEARSEAARKANVTRRARRPSHET